MRNVLACEDTKGGAVSVDLKSKKVIAIGERDGVQGQAIAEAVRSAGAEVLLQVTQCFV
jgi:betaine reductase